MRDARQALAQMSEADLGKMIKELGRYALSVSRSKPHWRTGDPVNLPRGESVDSIVSLAFEKVLTGERAWNPDQEPDLKSYLMGVIDSLLSHLSRHKDNTAVTAMPETAEQVDRRAAVDWQAQPPADPETALLVREQKQYEAHVVQLLLDTSQDDPVVAQIIRAMQAGHAKAGEIAEVLGIDVTEVYNAMKRLDRKIVRTRKQLHVPDTSRQ
jgi:DNA-directed RNA polymerase specialized sigma24 family protein